DYLSLILARNIKIEIDRTNQYNTFSVQDVISPSEIDGNDYNDYLSNLSSIAEKNKVQYIITGKYYFEGKTLRIVTNVYIAKLNKVVKLSAERLNPGVIFDDLIDEISVKIGNEFNRYYQLKSDEPLIEPDSGLYPYYVDVKLRIDVPNVELYYTINGENPTKDNSTKFQGEKIIITENSSVKVSAYRNGAKYGDTIVKDYKIKHQPDLMALTFSYSYLTFIDSNWNDIMDKSFPMMYSLTWMIDFGAINSVKSKPALRDFGFLASIDAAHAETNSSVPMHYNFWGVHGGLMYSLRFNRYFSVKFSLTGGIIHSVLYQDDEYEGIINMGKVPETVSSSTDPYFTASSVMTGQIGHILLTMGTAYRNIYFNENQAQIISYSIGAGYSF
ncbi:MAG: chitobiase/beta-hexosaminidase C-terminal domain-containing protein, partial [Spirochaetes bacterium]|nr:chitobiase/beta-hexosaminidase C-terminal domain-containing protein [Spirochaetota bacterium]